MPPKRGQRQPQKCAFLQTVEEAVRVTDKAFNQAVQEAGLAPHPQGECPDPANCRCTELAEWIDQRATTIIEEETGLSLDRYR